MALLFISNVVPDQEVFRNKAFNRSGNNVIMGICDSLPDTIQYTLISCRPVPSFPSGKIYIKGEKVRLDSGREVYIIPTLNIKIIKNLFWGVWMFFYIKKWAKHYRTEQLDILVYNIYTPPISWLYKSAKRTKSRLFAILYDLGVPPKRLKLSRLTMLGYKRMESLAHKYIPLLDGRIVINENIIDHYAPGKDFILIDGGISNSIVKKLFPIKETESGHLQLFCAGMLWDQNGTKLILSTMKKYPDLNAVVHFAGNGIDVPLIIEASKSDSRIKYEGMLNVDNLFKLYEKSDVLLNLRIEEAIDYHFPSKLLEYMATGKLVLSTPIAHAQRDYKDLIIFLEEITPDGLYKKILEINSLGKEEFIKRGEITRRFMLEQRQWNSRTKEIINYIHGNVSKFLIENTIKRE